MKSYYFIVNILIICVFIAVKGIKEDELKEELITEILHLMQAEAYTPMDKSLNSFLSSNYDLNDRVGTNKNLRNLSIIRLDSIIDHELKCIHCTIAFAAKHMINQFYDFAKRMNTPEKRDANLMHFGYVVSASAIVWRKAISAIISIKIEPGQWLWHILIFTNTLRQVTNKSYPGMTNVSNDEVFLRITNVLINLNDYLIQVGNGCLLKNEDVRDFKMPDDDTLYKDIFKAETFLCPSSDPDMNQLCNSYLIYVENFDKLLFRNHQKRIFSYDNYEMYDPDKWLMTYPTLKKILEEGPKTTTDWGVIETHLDELVKPISNQDWVLNYSDKYFATVENMSEVVRQTTLEVLKQNYVLCRNYWRSIKTVIGIKKIPFDFKNKCTGIQAAIGMIIKKFNLQTNKTIQTLYQLSRNIYTLDAMYDVIIKFINRDLCPSETISDLDCNNDDYPQNMEIIDSYKKEIKTYSNKLPELYTKEFALFKKSFDAKTQYITTKDQWHAQEGKDMGRKKSYHIWSIEIE